MSALAQVSPWYFLGRLSMAVALQVKAGAIDGREALEEWLASDACPADHREQIRKELKR